jgi:hypothetical protein
MLTTPRRVGRVVAAEAVLVGENQTEVPAGASNPVVYDSAPEGRHV